MKKCSYLLVVIICATSCKKAVNENEKEPVPPDPIATVSGTELVKKVETPLKDDIIFSKGIYLIRNTVMQSFDVDSKGTIYYDQLGGGLPHVVYVARGLPNKDHDDSMQLKYSGHGTNIAIEEDGEDRYVWIPTNGTKGSDGEYGSSKTFSRIKYVPNSVIESYGGDTFYFPGKVNVHPAIDMKNDLLVLTSSGGGDPLRYFYIYRLSKVKSLPLSTITLPEVKFGGEEVGVPQQTVTRTIQARNMADIAPIASFSVAPGAHGGMLGYYSFQGFDVSGDKIFFFEGEGNAGTLASGTSTAYLTVLNRKGVVVGKRTRVEAIYDLTSLNTFGITATGYMEAEGLKMKNGVLYVGFASKSTDDKRRANILAYK